MSDKWIFSVARTEDDHLSMLFSGKVPRGIMIVMVKVVASVGAIMAIIKQYFFS